MYLVDSPWFCWVSVRFCIGFGWISLMFCIGSAWIRVGFLLDSVCIFGTL